jgi:hypothetical protein
MAQKSETRAGARASRNSCGGWFRDPLTLLEGQAQFLIATHHVRPELAVTLAALTFGGGAA